MEHLIITAMRSKAEKPKVQECQCSAGDKYPKYQMETPVKRAAQEIGSQGKFSSTRIGGLLKILRTYCIKEKP